MKTRRQFLNEAGKTCLVLAGGSLFFRCSATAGLPAYEGDKITIPLASFNDKKFLIFSGKRGNVMVTKKEGSAFRAFSLKCTHRGGKVVEKNGALKCTRHGSKFDMDGHVTDGPAISDLDTFPASVEGDNVVVKLESGQNG